MKIKRYEATNNKLLLVSGNIILYDKIYLIYFYFIGLFNKVEVINYMEKLLEEYPFY